MSWNPAQGSSWDTFSQFYNNNQAPAAPAAPVASFAPQAEGSVLGINSGATAPQSSAWSAPTAAAPQPGVMGKVGNWLSNGNNLGTVVQGLGSLTQAYLGFRQLSMAKDQMKFQKDSWNKNFLNSQKTYNTSLEDRIRGRTSAYEGKENDVQSYLARHRLGS